MFLILLKQEQIVHSSYLIRNLKKHLKHRLSVFLKIIHSQRLSNCLSLYSLVLVLLLLFLYSRQDSLRTDRKSSDAILKMMVLKLLKIRADRILSISGRLSRIIGLTVLVNFVIQSITQHSG